jgi:hypothetical protein
VHTKDKLADALLKLGLMNMSLKARGGYYHDFLSPLAMPELQLCKDLRMAARAPGVNAEAVMALYAQVINGDFDSSKEESDDWAASPEGQDAFKQLLGRHKF